MPFVTVRFRGICCLIDPPDGAPYKKRILLPHGQHSDMEQHLPIVECFADELLSADGFECEDYSRPGDDARYTRALIKEPVRIDFQGLKKGGKFEVSADYNEAVIHLDEVLEPKTAQLRSTFLGDADQIDTSQVMAVIDVTSGVLSPGPPEAGKTSFTQPTKFTKRRVARWVELTLETNEHFALTLTPLTGSDAQPKRIRFEPGTRLISIGNEPLRMIVGQFVPKAVAQGNGNAHHTVAGAAHAASAPAAGAQRGNGHTVLSTNAAQTLSTTHFRLYWDLMADLQPSAAPTPEVSQGSAIGCAPANKP